MSDVPVCLDVGEGGAGNALISCAETWPGKSVHGSVGLSLQGLKP